jgi:hypothetical protein
MDSWVISQISFWYTVHEVRPSEADALPLHTVSFSESIEHACWCSWCILWTGKSRTRDTLFTAWITLLDCSELYRYRLLPWPVSFLIVFARALLMETTGATCQTCGQVGFILLRLGCPGTRHGRIELVRLLLHRFDRQSKLTILRFSHRSSGLSFPPLACRTVRDNSGGCEIFGRSSKRPIGYEQKLTFVAACGIGIYPTPRYIMNSLYVLSLGASRLGSSAFLSDAFVSLGSMAMWGSGVDRCNKHLQWFGSLVAAELAPFLLVASQTESS